MMQWNPSLYLKYGNERTQPSIDLMSRIAVDNPGRIIDLGCGPGNSTSILQNRWPNAELTGLDSSETMIALAKEKYPETEWVSGDITNWSSDTKYDIIFSNAALQWVSNHEEVFCRLVDHLTDSGVLAVQVPYHHKSPLHEAIVEVSNRPQWAESMDSARRALTYETASFYYDTLNPICSRVDIWHTEYYHIMESPTAILEWISGTGLRPFIGALTSDADKSHFKDELLKKYSEAYRSQKDGKVLFPFRRQFIIATK